NQWQQMDDHELLTTLAARLADRDIVTASVIGTAFAALPHGLIRNHTYAVSDVDAAAGTIQLHNPWGRDHPPPLTVAEFRQWVRYLTYGDFGPSAAPGASPPGH